MEKNISYRIDKIISGIKSKLWVLEVTAVIALIYVIFRFILS
jgi:hypothetical protein